MITLIRDDALGKLLIRLTVGGLLLFHGVAKILHPDSLGFISKMLVGVDLPGELAYGVYIGEIVAPLMIVLGVYCRLGGLVAAVNMLVAIWLAHSGDIFSLGEHGGWALELQAFYLLGGLAVVLLGSGKFAVKPD